MLGGNHLVQPALSLRTTKEGWRVESGNVLMGQGQSTVSATGSRVKGSENCILGINVPKVDNKRPGTQASLRPTPQLAAPEHIQACSLREPCPHRPGGPLGPTRQATALWLHQKPRLQMMSTRPRANQGYLRPIPLDYVSMRKGSCFQAGPGPALAVTDHSFLRDPNLGPCNLHGRMSSSPRLCCAERSVSGGGSPCGGGVRGIKAAALPSSPADTLLEAPPGASQGLLSTWPWEPAPGSSGSPGQGYRPLVEDTTEKQG